MFTIQDINKVVSAALATYEKAHNAQEENAACSVANRQMIQDKIAVYIVDNSTPPTPIDDETAGYIAALIISGKVPHVSVRWIL